MTAYSVNDLGVIAGGGELNGDDNTFLIASFPLAMAKLSLQWQAAGQCAIAWEDTDGVTLRVSSDLFT